MMTLNDLKDGLKIVLLDGFLLRMAGAGLVLSFGLYVIKKIMDLFPEGKHPLLDFELDDDYEPASTIEIPFYSKRRDPDDPIRR